MPKINKRTPTTVILLVHSHSRSHELRSVYCGQRNKFLSHFCLGHHTNWAQKSYRFRKVHLFPSREVVVRLNCSWASPAEHSWLDVLSKIRTKILFFPRHPWPLPPQEEYVKCLWVHLSGDLPGTNTFLQDGNN
jgi:hypothetical protein